MGGGGSYELVAGSSICCCHGDGETVSDTHIQTLGRCSPSKWPLPASYLRIVKLHMWPVPLCTVQCEMMKLTSERLWETLTWVLLDTTSWIAFSLVNFFFDRANETAFFPHPVKNQTSFSTFSHIFGVKINFLWQIYCWNFVFLTHFSPSPDSFMKKRDGQKEEHDLPKACDFLNVTWMLFFNLNPSQQYSHSSFSAVLPLQGSVCSSVLMGKLTRRAYAKQTSS